MIGFNLANADIDELKRGIKCMGRATDRNL